MVNRLTLMSLKLYLAKMITYQTDHSRIALLSDKRYFVIERPNSIYSFYYATSDVLYKDIIIVLKLSLKH